MSRYHCAIIIIAQRCIYITKSSQERDSTLISKSGKEVRVAKVLFWKRKQMHREALGSVGNEVTVSGLNSSKKPRKVS